LKYIFSALLIKRITKNNVFLNLQNKSTMKILFIQTGGTIDKYYPVTPNANGFEIGEPAFIRILKKAAVEMELDIHPLFKKDSHDLDFENLKELYTICSKMDEYEKIVITHGTDTIMKTAEYLSRIQNKTIVLTGSYQPESMKNSDADFNLGMAVGVAKMAPNGIYVVLKGKIDKINLKPSKLDLLRLSTPKDLLEKIDKVFIALNEQRKKEAEKSKGENKENKV